MEKARDPQTRAFFIGGPSGAHLVIEVSRRTTHQFVTMRAT